MKKTLVEKQLEFFEEMVSFYSEDTSKRAKEDGTCRYRTSDGRKCAIGRHLSNKRYRKFLEGQSISGYFSATSLTPTLFKKAKKYNGTRMTSFLPKRIQELGSTFLGDCQGFHDDESYWGTNGLTSFGEDQYRRMKIRIEDEHYKIF